MGKKNENKMVMSAITIGNEMILILSTRVKFISRKIFCFDGLLPIVIKVPFQSFIELEPSCQEVRQHHHQKHINRNRNIQSRESINIWEQLIACSVYNPVHGCGDEPTATPIIQTIIRIEEG
jgi:uncharacterized membrane protein YkgB